MSRFFPYFLFIDLDLRKPTSGKDVAPVLGAFWVLCGKDCYLYSHDPVSKC